MYEPEVSYVRRHRHTTTIHLTIHEGRKRIIRRACDAVGLKLHSLERLRIGPVELGDLAEGKHRNLTAGELEAFR